MSSYSYIDSYKCGKMLTFLKPQALEFMVCMKQCINDNEEEEENKEYF